MKYTVRKLFHITLATILGFYVFTGCLLTNEVGIKPGGTIKGSEAKEEIQIRGMMSFYMAMSVVYDIYNAACECNIYELSGTDAVDSYFAGVLAAAVSGIADDKYYTPDSVDSCVDEIQRIGATLVVNIHESARVAGTEALTDNSEEVLALQAGQCDIKESGEVIHLNDSINF